MFPSRKRFNFHIIPSDRQLWAIGMVAVTWTLLENMLQSTMYAIAAEDDPVRVQYDQTRSFKIRLDLLEAAASARMVSPHDVRFKALIGTVREAQIQRDRIIHGTWGGDVSKRPGDAQGVFNMLKPHPPFQWQMTFGDIKLVAERIDKLTFEWITAALDGEPKGPDILISDALRRKLRPQASP